MKGLLQTLEVIFSSSCVNNWRVRLLPLLFVFFNPCGLTFDGLGDAGDCAFASIRSHRPKRKSNVSQACVPKNTQNVRQQRPSLHFFRCYEAKIFSEQELWHNCEIFQHCMTI